MNKANVVETTDPVVQRVPLTLRQEYMARWEAYAASCRLNRPENERAEAYELARAVEERFTAALVVASSKEKRAKAQKVRG